MPATTGARPTRASPARPASVRPPAAGRSPRRQDAVHLRHHRPRAGRGADHHVQAERPAAVVEEPLVARLAGDPAQQVRRRGRGGIDQRGHADGRELGRCCQRRLVLDHHDQHAVGGHQLRGARGEIAIIRRQRDVGCVDDGLSGGVRPLVDPPLPAGRQADPDAVGGQVHAAPTTTASRMTTATSAAQRDTPAGGLPAPQPAVHADEVGRTSHPPAGQDAQPSHRAEHRADHGAGSRGAGQRRGGECQVDGGVVTTVTTPSPS